ncbi:MAG: ABC transporter permease [Longimicrobiales bacterium]
MSDRAKRGEWIVRLFGLLLRSWPAEVRSRSGEEAVTTFALRLGTRRRERRGIGWFVIREYAAVLVAGMRFLRDAPVGFHDSRLEMRKGRAPDLAAYDSEVGRGIVRVKRRRHPMDTLVQDVRFAVRGVVRNPGFSAVVVLVLALGIGANTAIFSVLNATLLRPLPVESPERLVTIRESNPEKGWEREVAAPANMLDWRERVEAFEGVAGTLGVGSVTLTGEGEPEILRSSVVTGNFFEVLGARAALGRVFRDAETWRTEPRVALLSDGFWTRRFGRDTSVIGRTITLNGGAYEVVGVMSAGFAFPGQELDVWTTMRWSPSDREQIYFRRAHYVQVIARVRRGVTFVQADAQLQTVVRQLQEEYPVTNRVMGAGLYPLQEFLTGEVRRPLLLVQGAVLLLFLVACANVGNLLLVRGVARRREMAVRAALGASRARIAAQVLTESFTLAVFGGVAGALLGVASTQALPGLLPEGLPNVGLDARVFAFAAGITALAGAIFGIVPALRGSLDLGDRLRDGGRSGSSSRRSLRVANLLVVSEIAVALVLVLGAGLLIRSFVALRDVDPGFRIDDRISARVTVMGPRYDSEEKINVFLDALLERLEATPGVRNVALVRSLPLARTNFAYTSDFFVQGWASDEFGAEVAHQMVSPSYLETMGVALLRGRFLEETDRAGAEYVLVINDALAKRYFPGEDPVGRRIVFDRHPTENSTWWTIVGVIGDQHQTGVGDAARIEVYKPYWREASQSLAVVVHSTRPAGEAVAALRQAVRALDSNIALSQVWTLEEIYAQSLRSERFLLVLMAAFGGLALLLAALGIYGVASQAAKRRTHEIGIRVALGARRVDVAGLILRQSLRLVGLGTMLGIASGLGATRVMESVLFAVEPADPVTFVTVPLLLATVALVATWLPVRVATRVDPMIALRTE